MSTQEPPPDWRGIDVSSTFLSFHYGFVLSAICFGVTIVQSWIYTTTNKDRWTLRSLVATLVVLDLAATILTSEYVRISLLPFVPPPLPGREFWQCEEPNENPSNYQHRISAHGYHRSLGSTVFRESSVPPSRNPHDRPDHYRSMWFRWIWYCVRYCMPSSLPSRSPLP
ncbi:hypothetical protein PM082_018790, partial [Marasmius tenuissimus]